MMPHALSSTSEDDKFCTSASEKKIVLMREKPRNRFYEPIVLLKVLWDGFGCSQSSRPLDLTVDSGLMPEDFRIFVNKLSQICDSERCGTTVTAFVLLQFPDRVQYRFASNRRDWQALEETKVHITGILTALKTRIPGDSNRLFKEIFLSVLIFNRPRISTYLEAVRKNVLFCIMACEKTEAKSHRTLAAQLRKVESFAQFSKDKGLKKERFAKQCMDLIQFIHSLHGTEPWEMIRSLAKTGQMDQSPPWSDLRHAMGRLLSYYFAIQVLLSMTKRLPQLFEVFEVKPILSSKPDCRGPFKKKDHSANAIIGRMTNDATEIQVSQNNAEQLQHTMGLDQKILDKAKGLRPFVHAEVLIDQSLRKDGHIRNSDFFHNSKYIGCSKPTCLLCTNYFSSFATDMEVRGGHGNLYADWKLPDVYQHEGKQAIKTREDIANGIVANIRKAAFRALNEKVSGKNKNDSNDSPTWEPAMNNTTFAGSGVEVGDAAAADKGSDDDLASRIRQVDITDHEVSWEDSDDHAPVESPAESRANKLDESDSDEENNVGGAML